MVIIKDLVRTINFKVARGLLEAFTRHLCLQREGGLVLASIPVIFKSLLWMNTHEHYRTNIRTNIRPVKIMLVPLASCMFPRFVGKRFILVGVVCNSL